MAIEIRELVIKAIIDDESSTQQTSTQEPSTEERDALIEACVEQVLRVLERQKER